MEAAALTARGLFLSSRRRRRQVSAVGVAFDELGGPVVALCGLTGGAGTTTLALALARHAAAASSVPVLVTESEPGRGLAFRAGMSTPHSLAALAERAAHGDSPGDAFVELESGLRLIATTERPGDASDAPLGSIIDQARDAHGLVVIDCGSTWPAGAAVLHGATHRVYVFPASPGGVAAADHTLPADGGIGVAVARDPNALVAVRTIRRAVSRRCERLVLVPYSADAARGQDNDEAVANAISRLAAAVRGTR